MNHQIDLNDLAFIEKRYGKINEWIPDLREQKTGRINPHVTSVIRDDGQIVSVFHIKPVYYETPTGHWRPLSEVAYHAGNHKIILNENWWKVHPRYLAWLDHRCKLIGGELLIASNFKTYPTPYAGVTRMLHESLVPIKMGLTTSTFYPNPHAETVSVDGHSYYDTSSTAWATLRVATDGGAANDSNTTVLCYVGDWDNGTRYTWLYRAFFLFDTSAIGDSETIDSATFSVKPSTVLNDDLSITTANKGFRLVATTPASSTAITAADYDQVGSTAGGTDTATTSFSAGSYYDWTLNATGLTWISKTGVTKLGVRHLCDVNDEQPDAPGSADDYNLLYVNSAEVADVTSDPKLVVVHSAGSSGPANVKTWNGITTANTKTVNGIAIANVNTGNGIV